MALTTISALCTGERGRNGNFQSSYTRSDISQHYCGAGDGKLKQNLLLSDSSTDPLWQNLTASACLHYSQQQLMFPHCLRNTVFQLLSVFWHRVTQKKLLFSGWWPLTFVYLQPFRQFFMRHVSFPNPYFSLLSFSISGARTQHFTSHVTRVCDKWTITLILYLVISINTHSIYKENVI